MVSGCAKVLAIMVNREDIVLLHRDSSQKTLKFCLPILRAIDQNECDGIGELLERESVVWQKSEAKQVLHEILPKKFGLYMFVHTSLLHLKFDPIGSRCAQRQILYVGKANGSAIDSSTIKSRYQREYSRYFNCTPALTANDPENREDIFKLAFNLISLEFWWSECRNREIIDPLERKLIKLFNPPLNNQHGLRAKIGSQEPAF